MLGCCLTLLIHSCNSKTEGEALYIEDQPLIQSLRISPPKAKKAQEHAEKCVWFQLSGKRSY